MEVIAITQKSNKLILLIVIITVLLLSVGIIIKIQISKNVKISNNLYSNTQENESYKNYSEKEQNENLNQVEAQEWKIEIPAISLIANISEGIEDETLSKYVGHFPTTAKTEGNVGLAGHNRGYEINYFENLKNLKGGEEIIYTYGEFSKTYVVNKNIKISEIDWSYLENSNKNQITLITCIENEPESRRCVQATEKEEN